MAVQGIRYETMTDIDGNVYDEESGQHALRALGLLVEKLPCWNIDVCKSHSPEEVHDLIDERDGDFSDEGVQMPLLKHKGEYLYPSREDPAIWDDRPSFDEDGNAGYYYCFVCGEELKG
jgi:hypothetical protein|tara:strand:- start:111 stop:467 length:357 start_codon:yes stop_codon:yes gene_type:complete